MDKKLRATAKKTPDGTPIPKAKPPPAAKKMEQPNAPPPSGTLQSYMARRKMFLHRKRRQNQAAATSSSTATSATSSSSTNEIGEKNSSKNTGNGNGEPRVKIEVDSFAMFENEMSSMDGDMRSSFIKIEQVTYLFYFVRGSFPGKWVDQTQFKISFRSFLYIE
jgi:hypothetical protein